MSDIKDEINSLEIATDTNNLSKLLSGASLTSVINTYRNLPQKLEPILPKFIPGKIQELSKLFGALSSSSLSSDKHGYSMKTPQKSPEAGSSPPVKQLLDEPETVTTIDTRYGKLYKVACLSDEEIWTSATNNTMKLYSINQGSLHQSITTKSGNMPDDITVTKSGDLVYTDNDVRTVNIVKNEKIEEVIRLQNWRPWGVCSTSSGDLLVIMESDDDEQTKVVCYSGSREKQTIQFDDKGKSLYSSGNYYRYITEKRNLDICVSDEGAKAVVVVNQAGKPRFRYTGHTPAPKNKPFSPRGITTDSQSHILTADVNNHCVHIIDQDGQFLRYIVCGLSLPWGLWTDRNDNLFVAQYINRKVKKIKYLK
ncbi:tripartite motif-containing protein 2-like [Saccostrea cucullata]|uniref:tripartite motif-containing protein 2-like n=1 Tax=Saccostrea cuccullata TaxID=36930 RepID=UPI002ED55048